MMGGDMLFLAGLFSIAMGLQALMLPRTPPSKEGVKPWAFLESLKMLKTKQFAIFVAMVGSFAFSSASTHWRHAASA